MEDQGLGGTPRGYKGYSYEVAYVLGGTAWVVYKDGEFAQQGTIVGKDLAAADSAARDWIDYIVATDQDGNSIPDAEEIVQDETPNYTKDYTGWECKSQSTSWSGKISEFSTIFGDGYYLDENKKGDILNLDANDSLDIVMPDAYKMHLRVTFRSQDSYTFQPSGKKRDTANIYLEGGDSFSLSIRNDEVRASLIQGSVERIDATQLADYNREGVRKTITVRVVMFEICTKTQQLGGGGGGGGGGREIEEDDTKSDFHDTLWMILGGIVLLLLVSYALNTTSEAVSSTSQ